MSFNVAILNRSKIIEVFKNLKVQSYVLQKYPNIPTIYNFAAIYP